MLKCVEGDDADRVVKLPRHEIGNDSFEVCPLDFGFAGKAAPLAETAIRAGGDKFRRPDPGLTKPYATERELNKYCHNLFRKALGSFSTSGCCVSPAIDPLILGALPGVRGCTAGTNRR